MPAHVRRLPALILVLVLALAACSTADDGATVREIGTEGGSASASGSGSASGSASASAPAAGSGSASGSTTASGSASGTATEGAATEGAAAPTGEDGGYAYATDVAAHRLVTEDVCAIKDQLEAEAIDYDAITATYVDGGASVNADGSVRTLQGFATAEDRLHGLDDHFESTTPLDDAMTAALEATGDLEGADDAVRAQVIEKTAQNRIMVAWTVHELESAMAKAEEGDLDPQEGAVHNWDEAWAFYHGAEPGCAPYATADSRAENFGTATDDGTAQANAAILAAMIEGRDALLAEDVEAARAAADEIRRNLVITYSQAAIRYATLAEEDVAADDLATAREHQAEGHAFWQVIAPYVAEAGADVEAVDAIFDLSAEPGTAGGDAVREALAPAWDALGIDDADIGELQ